MLRRMGRAAGSLQSRVQRPMHPPCDVDARLLKATPVTIVSDFPHDFSHVSRALRTSASHPLAILRLDG